MLTQSSYQLSFYYDQLVDRNLDDDDIPDEWEFDDFVVKILNHDQHKAKGHKVTLEAFNQFRLRKQMSMKVKNAVGNFSKDVMR